LFYSQEMHKSSA